MLLVLFKDKEGISKSIMIFNSSVDYSDKSKCGIMVLGKLPANYKRKK